MSEYINNSEKRLKDLIAFSLGMMNGENGKMLIEKYKDAIENVSPYDMLKLEDKQMQMGLSPKVIKKDVEKVINVFSRSLERYEWKKPEEGSFLYFLILENEAFTFKLNQIKKIIKSYRGNEKTKFSELKEELLPRFKEFTLFDYHYIKKENILFPYLEKRWKSYRPLKVMWSLHDDIRKSLKELLIILEDSDSQWDDFNPLLGKYFSLVFRMIQKENLIIFPISSETVDKKSWEEMYSQSFEYPFPFIETPQKHKEEELKKQVEGDIPLEEGVPSLEGGDFLLGPGIFNSETGNLTFEQILLVFNNLPVDITIVDENDKVKFFNNAKDRFFPRSPAIVGRSVSNCHPPESVHIVEEIVETFKNGTRDKAEFWIQMKGHFILIQYFALRNKKGEYKGIIEVSQDATHIRNLKGERRLLNWE